MKSRSDYSVVEVTDTTIFIVDLNLGNKSVTNDAESVVEDLIRKYGSDKEIVYRDSQNHWDVLCHDGNEFIGFAPYRGSYRPKIVDFIG